MGKYPNLHSTNKGRELVAESNAKKKAIEYTKAVIGDAYYNGSIDSLLAVVSPKMECAFSSAEVSAPSQFTINFAIDNHNLENGFYAREIGIYARLEGTEDEILFAYTNGGNYVDYIPDKLIPIDAQMVEAIINIGDAENVTIVKSDSTYLIFKDLQNHDNNENAHTPLLNRWINKSFSKFKEAVIGVVKDALTDILDIQAKMDTNGFVRMGFLWGFTIQWGVYIKVPSKYTFTYPIEFKSTSFVVIPIDLNVENNPIIFGVDNLTKNNATIAGRRVTEVTELWFKYIAIGF